MSFLYSKILIVDDEVEVCEALKEFFLDNEFIVETANDGENALQKVDKFEPHCILLDIKMPYLNGIDALGMIKLRNKDVEVIMVTAVADIKIAENCMRKGAFGFVPKPVDLDYLLKEVKSALEHRKNVLEEQKKEKKVLDHLKDESTRFQKQNKALNRDLYLALKFPFKLLAYNNPDFYCHCDNVAWLAKEIAERMQLQYVWKTALSAYYHDVGKLSLPNDMWEGYSDKWSADKKKLFRYIPILSQDIVQSQAELGSLGTIIRHQCENMDGSGYPDRLVGDKIPMESRIIAVANIFDEIMAMGGRRNIQQDMLEGGKVLDVINKDVGKKYDASVVEVLASIIKSSRYQSSREVEVALKDIIPEMVLSRDVITQGGKLILPHNTVLSTTTINKIILLNKIDPVVSGFYVFS
ncbi:MAG: hypothetical protein COV66_08925 [Nitrospinae bacterium CG11_big_fil_rev_8_21_14_0_20_45_15]|nr:MAG: hypothetical protein COV66_08925 [Nitrospinae bacterium CG11_big_fil_rev_8_21_14_0_20_45_15]